LPKIAVILRFVLIVAIALAIPMPAKTETLVTMYPVKVIPSTAGALAAYDISFENKSEFVAGQAFSIIFQIGVNLYNVRGDDIVFENRDDRIDVLAQSVVFRLTKNLPAGRHTVRIHDVLNPPTTGPFVIGLMYNGMLFNTPEFSFDSTGVTVADVYPKPEYINDCAEYTIIFKVATESGAGCTCSRSTIFYLSFPPEYYIPANIDTYFITMNGITVDRLTVDKNTIIVKSSMHFLEGMTVKVVISKRAGLKNPSKPGWYRMTVYSSADRVPTLSNPYYISPSSVTRPDVTLDSAKTCSETSMIFNFSTGPKGEIPVGGYINVIFPKECFVPEVIDIDNIAINGLPVKEKISTYSENIGSGKVVGIRIKEWINSSTKVELVILKGAGIKLPSEPGYYRIQIETSAEPYKIPSNVFYVEKSTISSVRYQSSPSFVTIAAEHVITFRTGGCGDLMPGIDSIFITFPEQMKFSSSILGDAGITVNDTRITTIPYINGRTLSINPPQAIKGDSWVRIVIPKECQLLNPFKAGVGYTVKVWTTAEESPVLSNVVAFASSKLSNALVTLTKNITFTRVGATIGFVTGQAGTLDFNTKIYIAMPEEFEFRGTVSYRNFEINGNAPISVRWSKPVLELANNGLILPNSVVTIEIDRDTGLRTPNNPGMYKFLVSTETEPDPVESELIAVNNQPTVNVVMQKPNEKGWHTTIPDVKITATSKLDGKPAIKTNLNNKISDFTGKVDFDQGFNVLEVWAVDEYGNKSDVLSYTILVDTIAPVFDAEESSFYTTGKSFFKLVRSLDENNLSFEYFEEDGVKLTQTSIGFTSIMVTSTEEKCKKGRIVATDEAGNKAEYEFTVCFDWTAPILAVTERVDTDVPVATVRGVTEPGATIDINGPVPVGEDGSFEIRLNVKNGITSVTVKARDKAGNVGKKDVTIKASLEMLLVFEKDKKDVLVNGQKITLKTAPYIWKGSLYVPFDLVVRNCVFKLESWPYSDYSLNTIDSKIIFTHPKKSVEIAADNEMAIIDGKLEKMSSPPQMKSGVLYVPIRFATGLFGLAPTVEGKSVRISYIKN
jgi:hypothetical protein